MVVSYDVTIKNSTYNQFHIYDFLWNCSQILKIWKGVNTDKREAIFQKLDSPTGEIETYKVSRGGSAGVLGVVTPHYFLYNQCIWMGTIVGLPL